MTTPRVLSSHTITSDKVKNPEGKDLGKIDELMVDMESGRIAYAVLSFGGFMGMGDKLFAIPWEALQINPEDHSFTLNVNKETLEDAPGFDKDNWPETTDRDWLDRVYSHYGHKPYWR